MKEAAIIDPGGNLDDIVAAITELSVNVKYILLTHGHPDHTFYADALASKYNAVIGMHEADISQLTDGLDLAEMFYDVSEYVDITPSLILKDGDEISLGNSKIKVMHTPGHTQGGISFITDKGVFCGDTIFAGSIGRTDFPGGSYDQIIDSIKSKILALVDATPLYPGHGPATNVGIERRSNPFLR